MALAVVAAWAVWLVHKCAVLATRFEVESGCERLADGGEPIELLDGFTTHSRSLTAKHKFTYPVWMVLAEMTEDDDDDDGDGELSPWMRRLARDGSRLGGWFGVRTGVDDEVWGAGTVGQPVARRVRAVVAAHAPEAAPVARVFMLSSAQAAGMLFNPITVFYCYDGDDKLAWLVAEVTNTPWGERVVYVLPSDGEKRVRKAMHVSPFNTMGYDYEFQFNDPRSGDGSALSLTITLRSDDDDAAAMYACLVLRPVAASSRRAFLAHKALTALPPAVVTWLRIHFEAAVLFGWRRVPFVNHPKYSGGE
ncbi:plasmid partition ParA protein [Thecamonas trahens ATCC 50062]|uniref:Plasmid partition ParA protein n=1 Tax=Thecamonas trahens ATCC 50062 TaxID=461836 RepID=A0A0L0DIU8_THETB|nr:plasmid partition ParA protein [Thecamonas trahens ATCC 50062]KNC52031.1 plasmid partition ParA protein [Thecamonas trahens ATCC 50062]|eukprot:XP_013755614.1 plasmid partition ParA protein [Thecamonas trahens ATCC 50062]